jgi:hypothetical protein
MKNNPYSAARPFFSIPCKRKSRILRAISLVPHTTHFFIRWHSREGRESFSLPPGLIVAQWIGFSPSIGPHSGIYELHKVVTV